ncbi:MAG: 2-oxo acid dehydrogenase subunit E2 [Fuerstiella sp.]|nr:2-oxo acid dehydrogenase subunit E2 [Fuerstiella sp.]
MPVEITVPRLGWSMDEGTFGGWLKKSGEFVAAGDMVFELEGEKAVHEIETFDSGTLHLPPDAPQPGDTVVVGQLIGYLLSEDDRPPSSLQSVVPSPDISRKEITPAGSSGNVTVTAKAEGSQQLATKDKKQTRKTASPRARRAALALGIDWNGISGTGRNGRVRERDVIGSDAIGRVRMPAEFGPVSSGSHHPASKIRKAVACRMTAAVRQAAPVTLTTKVNAARIVKFRNTLKSDAQISVVPGYTDIIVGLAATALKECPELNACWHNDGVFVYDNVNMGIAVDTERGLVVPVLNDVGSLELTEIARQSLALVEQAREGTLSQSQLQGGTFTVTSLGMFDIDFFTPILNLPQTAILGIGRIVREPVVSGDDIVAGETMGLSLTFDHRVIDGAPAARWLQTLSRLLQNPGQDIKLS